MKSEISVILQKNRSSCKDCYFYNNSTKIRDIINDNMAKTCIKNVNNNGIVPFFVQSKGHNYCFR